MNAVFHNYMNEYEMIHIGKFLIFIIEKEGHYKHEKVVLSRFQEPSCINLQRNMSSWKTELNSWDFSFQK